MVSADFAWRLCLHRLSGGDRPYHRQLGRGAAADDGGEWKRGFVRCHVHLYSCWLYGHRRWNPALHIWYRDQRCNFGMERHKNHDGCIGTKEYNGADDGGKSVKWTRIIVVIIGVCAYIITTFDLPLLVNIAMINYQGIGLLMIPLVGAVTWEKATKEGAFSGLIGGLLVTIALMTAGLNPLGFLPGIYGVIVEAILYIGISLATYKLDKPEAKMFEEFKQYTGDAVDGETGEFLA